MKSSNDTSSSAQLYELPRARTFDERLQGLADQRSVLVIAGQLAGFLDNLNVHDDCRAHDRVSLQLTA